MNIEKIKEIISKVKVPFTDETFYPRLFNTVLKEKKTISILEEEYGEISRRADATRIQESTSLRNVLRTRALANLFINEKGDVLTDVIKENIEISKKNLYSNGPGREYDAPRQELILKVLMSLGKDKELLSLLKSVNAPYQNKIAEEIIRNTLGLKSDQIITDAHAKKAAFSALMCYLRQSVGSCFGTAPAITVHDEQPKQFLRDIVELLGTGRLKRTYGGVEYSVPLSFNWGIGDLKKPLFFSNDESAEKNEIWYSPGLIQALESVSYFPEDFKLKNKIELTKELTLQAIEKLKSGQLHIVTNIEEIIRAILLIRFKLTEDDIINYEVKEKLAGREGMIFEIAQTNIPINNSKAQLADKFLKEFEIAKTAFKIIVDNALLKSWEFTLASFAENKAGFTTWNLYSSLGFKPSEKGGIGESLFEILKVKLEESNQKVHDFQDEYEQAYGHVKYLETRLRTASEKEGSWLKAEYQGKIHEFHFLEEMRNKLHAKAKRLASLFDLLIDIYMYFFPQYFQEVYDAGMQDVAASQYDDSPAGFRLLFKHGRGNTAQWTLIYTAEEFIDALVSFFTSTESEIKLSSELEGLETEFSEIVTAIVLKIRSDEFLESAFARMAEAHHARVIKDPLHNLDKIEKKPWAYVSGGNMGTLIRSYYKMENKPNEVSRWVESPTELLVFLADSMKQLPQKIKDEYINQPNKSMLIHSPTHAFLLKPGFESFKRTWLTEGFTYTYVRDLVIAPMERFIRQMVLNDEMMEYFINQLLGHVPLSYKNYIRGTLKPIYKTLSPIEFRAHLKDQLDRDRSLIYEGRPLFSESDIDMKLYAMLPFTETHQLKMNVQNIFKLLPKPKNFDEGEFNEILDAVYDTVQDIKILPATRLQDVCKAIICLISFNTSSEVNYHLEIIKACRELGLAIQEPIIVADTNWVKDYFGFVVNPGTGDLEFWRVNLDGTIGHPMRSWDQWLNGSRRDLTWGIYNHPYEYSV